MESGAPERDTPDNEDFEGEGRESEQLPEEAPREVTEPGRRGEKRGGKSEKHGAREGEH
jgi:hypothetical protein